jgi:hypothetical protein
MKAYWGGGRAPLILWPRHLMEMSGQLHAPATLTPEKEPLVPRAGLDAVVREKFPAPAGNRTPDHPARTDLTPRVVWIGDDWSCRSGMKSGFTQEQVIQFDTGHFCCVPLVTCGYSLHKHLKWPEVQGVCTHLATTNEHFTDKFGGYIRFLRSPSIYA